MPYVMRQRKSGKIDVVNPTNNKVMGSHNTKRQAIAQLRALYANVPDALNKRRNIEPTNSQLWMQAKALASRRFAVYPSAYATSWASNWYKEHGGEWRDVQHVPTESIDPRAVTKTNVETSLLKMERQYKRQQWVDITQPVRDIAGVLVGYQQTSHDSDKGYPMRREYALGLTEDEREKLIVHRFGRLVGSDGTPEPKREQPIKKYGRYKRK